MYKTVWHDGNSDEMRCDAYGTTNANDDDVCMGRRTGKRPAKKSINTQHKPADIRPQSDDKTSSLSRFSSLSLTYFILLSNSVHAVGARVRYTKETQWSVVGAFSGPACRLNNISPFI